MFKNTLTIYSPIDISSYGIHEEIYNEEDNTLTFSVISGNYQRIEEGSKYEILDTTTGIYKGVHKLRVGFTAKLLYTDIKLPMTITEIANYSWDNNIDITIRDRRRIELVPTDYANKYTDRVGRIYLPLQLSDILTTVRYETQIIEEEPVEVEINEHYLEEGFSIVFKETGLR